MEASGSSCDYATLQETINEDSDPHPGPILLAIFSMNLTYLPLS